MRYDQQQNQAQSAKPGHAAHPKNAEKRSETLYLNWQQTIGNRAVMQRMRTSVDERTDTATSSRQPQGTRS